MRKQILIIGAGAAGLMAACAAADAGAKVTVLEQGEKAGKKIYITGKGRCNYTNACETQDFFRNVLRNPKFLYSAVYRFDAASMTAFLNDNGCPTKVERGQRCFPASDHAFDVTDALVRHLTGKGGRIRLHSGVRRILIKEMKGDLPSGKGLHEDRTAADKTGGTALEETGNAAAFRGAAGVELLSGQKLYADAVIVATGGVSYPSTGSTGDGYRFARDLGLSVNAPQPSLVPLETAQEWPRQLQGLSLKNVAVRVEEIPAGFTEGFAPSVDTVFSEDKEKRRADDLSGSATDQDLVTASAFAGKANKTKSKKKPVYEGFGEMLFTHFGVSGPLILSASCHTDFAAHPEGYLLHLDLKPALGTEELALRLHREFDAAPTKELRSVLRSLLPQRLSETICDLYSQRTGWEREAPVRAMNEKGVKDLALLLKDVTMHLAGTRGFAEAIVTRGGISVKEINPSTMETRRIHGLYWAGEVLDVDAYTGGFNLQIAWSTGHLAGESAAV